MIFFNLSIVVNGRLILNLLSWINFLRLLKKLDKYIKLFLYKFL